MKPYAAYAIGAALVDTEIRVTDAELAAMNVEKGMMALVDQARQRYMLKTLMRPDYSTDKLPCGARLPRFSPPC